MPRTRKDRVFFCPVEVTISLIGGKWKSLIIYWLIEKKIVRFGELRKLLSHATPQMLTAQLRELEADGLIQRKVYTQVPPKVEYSLTKVGESLTPLILSMTTWGKEFVENSGNSYTIVK